GRPDPAICGNGIVETGEECDDGNDLDADGCTNDCRLSLFSYLKASNTAPAHHFGTAIAMSGDGTTLAVAAPLENSAATGIDDSAPRGIADAAGAVYVFVLRESVWTQQAYVKASNTAAQDEFGSSVALSADGNTLAVGALNESSGATGSGAGAVYMYTRAG